jgi:hypothetical protein
MHLVPLGEAARAHAIAAAPPEPFAVGPGDEAWAEIGAPPLQPAELAGLMDAILDVAALKLRLPAQRSGSLYERD